jgi:hypothetical protein
VGASKIKQSRRKRKNQIEVKGLALVDTRPGASKVKEMEREELDQ